MLHRILCAAITASLAGPALSAEATSPDQRMKEIEQRLDRIETSAPTTTPSNPTASAGSFNPAISLILSGIYTNLSQDPANYHITGFAVPSDVEIGPGQRGFSLAESELGVYANIDHYFYGGLNQKLVGVEGAEPIHKIIA